MVGITGYIAHVNIIKEYALEVKEFNKNIKVIVGGVHAEVNPEDFECKSIDYIIRANGIKTFINILERLENKKKEEQERNKYLMELSGMEIMDKKKDENSNGPRIRFSDTENIVE